MDAYADEELLRRSGEGEEEDVGADVVVDWDNPSRIVRRPVMVVVLREVAVRECVLRMTVVLGQGWMGRVEVYTTNDNRKKLS